MTAGDTTWSYTYDANGMRTSRSNGSKTYNYVYNGSQLVQMTVGNDTLYFTYGLLGPTTVTWNGETYYYALNGQGDVTGIFDEEGTLVVIYNWDNAWGYNPQPEGSLANTLGTLNPLRYRGYVYDVETGYYYLQSRYYDPEIGRFINADAFVTTGGLLGNNMFTYCLNNPILYFDSTGTKAQIWPVLFGDHNFGYIHRAVQAHIIAMGLLEKELYLPGIGRADIYNPKTKEIWEIKHGGSTSAMQENRILSADAQVSRYITQSKEKNNQFYRKGYAGAFTGGFVINCGYVSYSVTYYTPEDGVILYYVKELEHYIPEVSVVYKPSSITAKKEDTLALIGLGAVAGLTYLCGGSLFDPLCRTSPAY